MADLEVTEIIVAVMFIVMGIFFVGKTKKFKLNIYFETTEGISTFLL